MKPFLLILSLISIGFNSSANTIRVLFLGNSYTFVNDLPGTFKQVAGAMGDSVYVDSFTPGGYTLQLLSTDPSAIAKIQLGNWDYVVLQAQSQEPSFSPSQVQTNTYPYAQTLNNLINTNNTCAETLFYMTWGRKNGDASNCAAYPPICTYAGMQQRLRESYLEMTQANHASVSPVGMAWKHVRDAYPAIELYQPDESHPSIYGTYLAACVFYSSIFHKSASGCSYVYPGISATDATILQNTGSSTVLDSIETWQQHGDIPLSSFSVSSNMNVLTTTNTSMRYSTLLWDFGDGTTSTLSTPQHTYTAPGSYVVKLTVTNACGKKDIKSMVVTIGTPNALQDEIQKNYEVISLGQDILVKATSKHRLLLMNMEGRIVFDQPLHQDQEKIYVGDLTPGVYTYQLLGAAGNRISGKILLR